MSHSVEVCLLTDDYPIDRLLEAIEPLEGVDQVRCLPKHKSLELKAWYVGEAKVDPRLLDQVNAIKRYLYQTGPIADSLLIIDTSVEPSSLMTKVYHDLLRVMPTSQVDCVLLANQSGMANMTPEEDLGELMEVDLPWSLYGATDKTRNTAAVWMKRSYAVRCLELLSGPLKHAEGVVSIHNWAQTWVLQPPVVYDVLDEPLSYPPLEDDSPDIWTVMEVDPDLLSWLTFGCTASPHYTQLMQHVLTLRRAVETSDDDGFVITEGAASVADNYSEIMDELLDKAPGDASIVLLAHTVTDWSGMEVIDLESDEGELTHLIKPHRSVYGTFGYWISREWALECLEMYDRPLRSVLLQDLSPRKIVYTDETYMLKTPILYPTDTTPTTA